MKIAVQLFGNLRTFKQCAPYLKKHLLNHYDCDVFMHTWDTIDHNSKTWHSFKVKHNTNLTKEDIEQQVKKAYPITDLLIETQGEKDEGTVISLNREISLFGMRCMTISMAKTNKLRENYEKEHKIEYDYVIFLRPDVLLNRKFDFNEFTECLSEEEIKNSLFTGGFPMFSILNDYKLLGATDVLFFAKPETISKALTTHPKALEQMAIKKEIPFGPEYYIIQEIQNANIKPLFMKFNNNKTGDFELLRGTKTDKKFKSLLKKAITLHIKKDYTKLHLIPGATYKFIRLKLDLGDLYSFDIGLGRIKD